MSHVQSCTGSPTAAPLSPARHPTTANVISDE